MTKIKILLTGANGFVGRTLSKQIDRQRYSVTLAVSPDSYPIETATTDHVIQLDIRNEADVIASIKNPA